MRMEEWSFQSFRPNSSVLQANPVLRCAGPSTSGIHQRGAGPAGASEHRTVRTRCEFWCPQRRNLWVLKAGYRCSGEFSRFQWSWRVLFWFQHCWASLTRPLGCWFRKRTFWDCSTLLQKGCPTLASRLRGLEELEIETVQPDPFLKAAPRCSSMHPALTMCERIA